MQKSTIELSEDASALLDLGVALGQNQTFSLVAGRCSAAQAATLLRLRQEQKLSRSAPPIGASSVQSYLKISGSEADRIIRLWEEFGASYFELAQLIRISPEGYRAIEPAVKDGALHHEGEAIEFDAENSRKLAEAVTELRGEAARTKPARKAPRQREMHQRIADLDRSCTKLIREFQQISRRERSGENWILLTRVLMRARNELSQLERENGL